MPDRKDKPAVTVEQRSEAAIVHVQVPDLDEEHIAKVRAGIAAALAQPTAAAAALPFILDLAPVKFVPSLTLGALVQLFREFRARRQRLIMVNLQPTVRQLFAITQLNKLFEIEEDVPAALRSLGVPA